MPVEVSELARPVFSEGDQARATLVYLAEGDDDEAAIIAAVLAEAPLTVGTLVYGSIEATILDGAADKWEARVEYVPVTRKRREPLQTGESQFSFDTTGGTEHIAVGKSVVSVNNISGGGLLTTSFGGGIGINGDDVTGLDVTVPQYAFSEKHIIANSAVDGAYKATLFALTGTVNNASFKGFAAGEVLFLGAVGTKRGAGDWEIDFRFAASPNKTGLTVGSITGINKKGWEYLDVWFETREDTTANIIARRPAAVFIHKVYDEADFAGLGIGT